MNQIELEEKMSSTFQTQGQTILQHGYAVHEEYKKILTAIKNQDCTYYRLPDGFTQHPKDLFPIDIMQCYHIFHDCGKPFCIRIDENGRRHFDNHSEVSYNVFTKVFPGSSRVVHELIRSDMIYHSGTEEQLENLIRLKDSRFIMSLLLTAFAEIYANCRMFGGCESVSFTNKHERLCQVYKTIMTIK